MINENRDFFIVNEKGDTVSIEYNQQRNKFYIGIEEYDTDKIINVDMPIHKLRELKNTLTEWIDEYYYKSVDTHKRLF